MLGKMIKHEFKATSRLFLPLYAVVIVLTPILALLYRLAAHIGRNSPVGSFITGTSVAGYVIMLIGLCIASVLFIVIRFYRTVVTSDAYLTFCLPVKPGQILFSKLLTGVVWEITSVCIVILSILLTLVIEGSSIPGELRLMLAEISPIIGATYGSVALFFVHIALLILVSAIAGTLAFFLAICLGQLFNQRRVIASIGMYVAVYMACQMVSMAVMMPFMLGTAQTMVIGNVSGVDINISEIPTFGILTTVLVLQICFAVVYFIISSWILKKKINLR